jgi:hypothetical protein
LEISNPQEDIHTLRSTLRHYPKELDQFTNYPLPVALGTEQLVLRYHTEVASWDFASVLER